MIRDRTLQTVFLAAVIVSVGVIIRPRDTALTGMSYTAFQHHKMTSQGQWDLVFAGDSRTLMGLLPAAMETNLPDTRTFNFAFDHAGYSAEYLDALGARLDPESPRPSLLLGITPQSVTQEAATNSGFSYLANKRPLAAWYDRYVGMHLQAFAPFDLRLIWHRLGRVERTYYYRHYSEDGSVPSRKVPEDTLFQVRRYQGRFDGNQVSSELVAQLMRQVRSWTDAGVEVYAIRLPTSLPMRTLEDQESGFSEPTFVREFQGAGGAWIPVPDGRYLTHDGSHLRQESAEALSKRVAEVILGLRKRTARLDPIDFQEPGLGASRSPGS